MRVLLSTDAVGGVWDYTTTLVHQLDAAGYTVLLAVLGEEDAQRFAALPAGVEVEARPFRLEWMPGAAQDVAAAGEWLASLAHRWGPDLVHLNQMAYGAQPFGAPTLVVVHSDVLSWFQQTLGGAAPPEWDVYAGWVRAGIAGADRVVAPTQYQSELCGRHYGRAADRVIHNGAPPPSAAPPRESEPGLVLSVGRAWDQAKGMHVLDAAAGLLGPAAGAVHVLGGLRGPHGERFEARHLRCHGRVSRAEVDRWMERAGLYAGASLYEPFGLAPLEAAQRGCALVLSDIGSFRELWDGCAAFVPPGDAAALADTLRALHADPERRATLAHAARGRALERYTARRFAHQYVRLYEEMAAAKV